MPMCLCLIPLFWWYPHASPIPLSARSSSGLKHPFSNVATIHKTWRWLFEPLLLGGVPQEVSVIVHSS